MQAAIECLRAELATLDTKRELVTLAIASVERAMRADAPPVVDPPTPEATPRDPVGVARVDTLIRSERKASASMKGDEARVVELLTGRGEMSPKSIATTLEMAPESCRWVLKKLRQKGIVETHGNTHACMVRLKMAKSPVVVAKAPAAKRTKAATPVIAPAAQDEDDLVVAWSGSTKRSPEDVLREQRGEVRS